MSHRTRGSVPKVVFVADRIRPRLGMERALEDLVMVLDSAIEVVLISGPAPLPGDQRENLRYVKIGARPGWFGRVSSAVRLRKALKTSFGESPIVAVGMWAYVAVAIALFGTSKKVMLWEHSALPWRLRHEWRVAVAAYATKLFRRRLKLVVCVSASNQRSVDRILASRVPTVVIPNVTPEYHPEPSGSADRMDPRRLLGIGTINAVKNWEIVVEALSYLDDEYTLTIAGDGPSRLRVERLAQSLGVASRVNLLGHVPDAAKLLREHCILVHPSLAETYGYVLFEAAGCGVPVIAIGMPVMSEVIPALVPGVISQNSPLQIAEAIEFAAQSPPDYWCFDEAALERRERFSPEAIISSWSEALGWKG